MAEEKKEKVEFDDQTLFLLEGNLKRIFAMKVSRSTFRELQNMILACTNHNKPAANALFEILLTGKIPTYLKEKHREIFEEITKDYTIPVRLAKDVFEKGEFINLITSDLVGQQDEIAFLNRLRRIDGEEFIFLSDPQNTINVLQHFAGRLFELQKAPNGKGALDNYKKELTILADRLKQLAL